MSKKRILIAAVLLVVSIALVAAIPLFQMAVQKPIIGTIKGPECQWIEIDGVRYVEDRDGARANEFSGADRGAYLGSVTNGAITMRVFSVKGDDSGKFLYTLWDWEGTFYSREGLNTD